MNENRFYNYDDALAGIVAHLSVAHEKKARNLSLLITDGAKRVEGYDPQFQKFAASFLENAPKTPTKRLQRAENDFDFHVYTYESFGKLNATVVIDELCTATAAGMLAVIRDTLTYLTQGKTLTVGSVYLFAVEASI